MKHAVSALLQDHPGALNRAVSLLRRHDCHIDTLTLGASETVGVSRMTLVVEAGDIEKVVKQLRRLIDVLQV